jgi:mediator of RNA polymerase II transcription subunit 5
MASSEQWRTFLCQCLMNRIDVHEFRDLSKLLSTRCPIPESALLDALLEAQDATGAKWDPLPPLYIDVLSKTGRLKASSVLGSLLKHSSVSVGDKPPSGMELQNQKRKRYTLMTDVKIVQDVMLAVSTGSIPRSVTEAAGLLSAVADWIQAVLAWNSSRVDDVQQDGLMGSPDATSLFESLGILLAVLAGAGKGLEVLSVDSHQGISN